MARGTATAPWTCWNSKGPGASRALRRLERGFGLAAELPVHANTGNEEVGVVVFAEAEAAAGAADRGAGVRHADDAVAEEVVIVVVVPADPQPFELDRQVVGPGVLDAGTENPAGVVVAVLAEEPAGADRRTGQRCTRADVERRRKLG